MNKQKRFNWIALAKTIGILSVVFITPFIIQALNINWIIPLAFISCMFFVVGWLLIIITEEINDKLK